MDDPFGMVFDIKEFALYDGPGLRCTVFLKGCPLRCAWCHNPEGLRMESEDMRTAAGTRRVGAIYHASELAGKLLGYAPVFSKTDGGITFSGGEPLLQAEFVAAVMERLGGRLHLLLQTSGQAPEDAFLRVAGLADLVYFDLKLMNPDAHARHTGTGNARILSNLKALGRSGMPYRLRVPLIPDLTDTPENYTAMREFIDRELAGGNGLQGVDLLPYNPAAGGKYAAVGMTYALGDAGGGSGDARPEYFADVVKEVLVL